MINFNEIKFERDCGWNRLLDALAIFTNEAERRGLDTSYVNKYYNRCKRDIQDKLIVIVQNKEVEDFLNEYATTWIEDLDRLKPRLGGKGDDEYQHDLACIAIDNIEGCLLNCKYLQERIKNDKKKTA